MSLQYKQRLLEAPRGAAVCVSVSHCVGTTIGCRHCLPLRMTRCLVVFCDALVLHSHHLRRNNFKAPLCGREAAKPRRDRRWRLAELSRLAVTEGLFYISFACFTTLPSCFASNDQPCRGRRLGDPQYTNFGRDIVFSADLCYNGITS